MEVSISSDISSAWRLPLSSSELAGALDDMWREFASEDDRLPSAKEDGSPLLLEFALVDDAEMARLNAEYLGCAGPTNILAFPSGVQFPGLPEGSPNEDDQKVALPAFQDNRYLGWLAMSPATIRREAMLYRQDLLQHTLRLMAHGLAHLLGYAHGEEMDFAAGRASDAALARLSGQMPRPGAGTVSDSVPSSVSDSDRQEGGSR